MRVAVFAGAWLVIAAGWPTESHDVRGPSSAKSARTFVLTGEQAVNMPVTD